MSNVPTLPVTLVIVSDFEPGPKTWHDEDECLRRSMEDATGVPAQIVIAASSEDRDTPTPDWSDIPAPVEVVFVDSTYSGTIKDAATGHATQDLLAVVEADCIAAPGWLTGLYRKHLEDPALDAVTGLTMYPPTSAMRRVAGLYDRGYLEETHPDGDAVHISNNGALYKKQLLLDFPYDAHPSPFVSAHRRHDAMQAAGIRVGLARDAVQYHAYGGWPFMLDVRKNKGLQHQIMKGGSDGALGLARRIRWVLRTVLAGVAADYGLLRRSFGTYCKPRDLPLALLLPLVLRPMELWGAAEARKGRSAVAGTSYR